MDWTVIAGIAVPVFLSLAIGVLALQRTFHEDRGAGRVWRQMIEDRIKRVEQHSADHYTHSRDQDAHFTQRERDALTRQLTRIEELIKESMTQRAQHVRHSTED